MDIDDQRVGPGRDRGQRQRFHQVWVSTGMAGIHHDRQVGALLPQRDRGEVQREARRRFKCANSPLAQHNLVIALEQQIFGGGEGLLHGAAEAALEYDRKAALARGGQQGEVLHVPCTDLQPVDHRGQPLDVLGIDNLGDDGETRPFPGLGQQVKAVPLQALEGMWRGPRFEDAAPQADGAVFGDDGCGGHRLFRRFDRARSGDHHDGTVADRGGPEGNLGTAGA